MWGRWNCEGAGATYFIALVGIFLLETLDFLFKEERRKLYKGKESETQGVMIVKVKVTFSLRIP